MVKNENDGILYEELTIKKGQKATYCKTYNLENEMERKMYTDQTGRFPTRSHRGYEYIMVLFEVDSNAILVEPHKSRRKSDLVNAYQKLVDRLKARGFHPKLHILDNEKSSELEAAIVKNDMTFQYVTPNDHRRNIAEKAIQVFKDHFIAVLCGTDVSFPAKLWCYLLVQAEHQLNMLRKSRVDKSKSSYEVLYGQHDYNANPWAPLGAAIEVHVVPQNRKTWSEHTLTG